MRDEKLWDILGDPKSKETQEVQEPAFKMKFKEDGEPFDTAENKVLEPKYDLSMFTEADLAALQEIRNRADSTKNEKGDDLRE